MDEGEKRIALLIDADNAPASKIDVILAEVARHGAANVRRAYGNWKSARLKPWEATLHDLCDPPDPAVRLQQGQERVATWRWSSTRWTCCTRDPGRVRHRLERCRLHPTRDAAPDRWR